MRPYRPAIAALLLAVAAACSESNAPVSPTPASLTLAGDPVYCDSCDTAAFDVVAGVDLSQVRSAVLVRDGGDGSTVSGDYQLQVEQDRRGSLLHVTVTFTDVVTTGDYRLELRDADGTTIGAARAMRVVRAWHPLGDSPSSPPGSGILRITVVSTGPDAAAAFTGDIAITDLAHVSVGLVTDSARSLRVAPGTYRLSLKDIAPNCHAVSPQAAQVTVTAGAVTDARMNVACVALATVVLSVSVRGTKPLSGASLACDYGGCGAIDLLGDARQAVFRVLEGRHTMGMSLSDDDCRAESPDPVEVSVVSGDTTHVEFKVVCGPMVGTAVVIMRYTLGASPPPPVAVYFSTNYPLTCAPYGCVGNELDFTDGDTQNESTVPSGTYAFVISPVPPGCMVTSPMPAYATVPVAGVGSVTFELDCR